MATRYWVGGSGTWNASSTANWSASSGGLAGASAPTSADTVIFDANSGTGVCTTSLGAICSDITLNSSSLGLKLSGNFAMSGTFTLTQNTLDLNNKTLTCGTFSSNNSNTRSIAFGTGAINITGSNATVWTTSSASNFTYTGIPTVNLTYSGSTGTRVCNHGGSGGATEGNSPSFNFSSGSDTISVYTNTKNLDLTGFSGTLINFTRNIYGNLNIPAGATVQAGVNTTTFAATSGTQTITSNGQTIDFPIFKAGAGTLQLQDALTLGTTRSFTHTSGTVDLNGKTLTVPVQFSTNNSNVRSIAFNGGTITLPGASTAWNAATATNLTTSGTGVINLTSASAKRFAGGGASYPMLNQGGAGALTITGANTFADLINTVRAASIVLQANTVTTLANMSLNGSSGNLMSITSSTSGAQTTINKTSGQVGLQYCSIKDIKAQGGAKFRAPSNYGNTSVSNNTGWDFGALNITQDNFMFFFGDTIR